MSGEIPDVTLDDVLAARADLEGVMRATPLKYSRALSERVDAEVSLKCENLQRAGSFKFRGAYTRLSRLSDAERSAGVVAASAGNHAQGVALAAQMLGIRATIYMPVGAAMPKVNATRAYGAQVEQVGLTLDDAMPHAQEYARETGAVYIHPFDHRDIVAGQGTCGLEILEQCPDVRTVVVGVGGGGLIAGISVVMKALKPDVRIVGVQAEGAAAYPSSLEAGRPVACESMHTMADGIAVGLPGKVPFELIRRNVERVDTVSEEDISRALLHLLERSKLVVEPAGGVGVARLLDGAGESWDGPVVAVLSGGNIDPLLLLRIIRHGMAAAGRYLQLSVRVPDKPGSLAQLLSDCADVDANVLEVEHVRINASLNVDEVEIAVELETKSDEHREEVLAHLRDRGYRLVSVDG